MCIRSPRCSVFMSIMVVLALGVYGEGMTAAQESKPIKFARFQVDDRITYGVVEGKNIREISAPPYAEWQPTDRTHRLDRVRLLVPTQPTQVFGLAGNYKSHLEEGDTEISPKYRIPQPFFKSPSCLVANGADIVIPEGTEEVHYEAEMVIVIGKTARKVPKEKALDYVLGVTTGNDISARDWQENDVQWWRAKGSDTFGPCGPFIVSGINYDDLLLQLRLNGEVRQRQRTSDLIHDVRSIVSFLSRHVTLRPGDLIFTGTPGETSAIKPGDAVEVELEGVGTLRNRVVGNK